ncbi:MAG: cytochrome P450 [Pseudomonadota bacterium]
MSQKIAATMLLDRAVLDDPYPFYKRLQAEAPVWQVPGTPIFLITRYALLEEAVRRVEDFSSSLTGVLYRKRNGLPGRVTYQSGVIQVLATADPPIHTLHKTAVFSHFSAKRVAELKPEIEQLAITCVENAIAKGKVDFMGEIANPLPMRIVSDLVGFRESNTQKLLQAAFDSTAVVSGSSSIFQLGWYMLRSYHIYRWIGSQLRSDAAEKPNILESIKHSIKDGTLSEIEGRVFLLLFLAAGGESTTSLLGSAVRILAANPALQQTLREQPALIPPFLEEVLRLESPFRFHLRSTNRDTVLGNVAIPAGATVLLFWGAGNRDPETFKNPDDIDLTRPKKHMTFGRGIHTCIGAPLARLEAQTVLEVLLDRTEQIALDPNDSPRWVESLQVRRYERLPIVLTPGRARTS